MFVILRDSEDFAIHYVLDVYEQLKSTKKVYALMNLVTFQEYAVLDCENIKQFFFDFGGSHCHQIVNDLAVMCRTKHEFNTGRINYLNTGWFISYQGQSFVLTELQEVEEDYVLAQAVNVVLSEFVHLRQFFYRDIRYPSEDYGVKLIGMDFAHLKFKEEKDNFIRSTTDECQSMD